MEQTWTETATECNRIRAKANACQRCGGALRKVAESIDPDACIARCDDCGADYLARIVPPAFELFYKNTGSGEWMTAGTARTAAELVSSALTMPREETAVRHRETNGTVFHRSGRRVYLRDHFGTVEERDGETVVRWDCGEVKPLADVPAAA